MKFKAVIKDSRTFAAVCRSSQSFQKRCIIKLQEDRVRFITSTGVTDGTQIWTSCRVSTLFSEFRIESSRQNIIFIEVPDMSILSYALKNCERALNPTLKLARSDQGASLLKLSYQHSVTHHDASYDIPIRVLGDADIDGIVAPPLERDVLQVVLPNLSETALFLEKARAATQGSMLTFTLQRGQPGRGGSSLTLTTHTMTASFSLQYQNVDIPSSTKDGRKRGREEHDGDEAGLHDVEEEEADADELQSSTVSIDAKRFVRFLSVREVNPVKVVAHLVNQRAVVLSAYASGETNLVYYIPAMAAGAG